MIDECDFCGNILDKDEELTPIFIGNPPAPKPIHLQGFSEQPTNRKGDQMYASGYTVGEYLAIIDALESADIINFDTYAETRTVESVGGLIDDKNIEPSPRQCFQSTIDENKAGARVRIKPKFDEPEPDMQVCKFCKEAIQQ